MLELWNIPLAFLLLLLLKSAEWLVRLYWGRLDLSRLRLPAALPVRPGRLGPVEAHRAALGTRRRRRTPSSYYLIVGGLGGEAKYRSSSTKDT